MDFVISLLFRGTCSKHFLERPTMWQWSLFLLCWMTLDACNEIKILCRTWSWKECLYLWSFIFFCSSCCSCSYMRSFLHFQPNASIKWESSQGSSWLVFSFCRFCLFLTATTYDCLTYTSWRTTTENSQGFYSPQHSISYDYTSYLAAAHISC